MNSLREKVLLATVWRWGLLEQANDKVVLYELVLKYSKYGNVSGHR
jgi:hypothetical protein